MIATGFIIWIFSSARYSYILKTRGGMPVQTAVLLIVASLVGLGIAVAGLVGGAA
jgi:hypothetical protein